MLLGLQCRRWLSIRNGPLHQTFPRGCESCRNCTKHLSESWGAAVPRPGSCARSGTARYTHRIPVK